MRTQRTPRESIAEASPIVCVIRRYACCCATLGIAAVLIGCVNTAVEHGFSEPVPPEAAWIHGLSDPMWASMFVRQVDGTECGRWWEPEAPVTVAPGSRRLTIQFESADREDHPSGFLSNIEVTLDGGTRYRVRHSVMKTPMLGQFATKIWIEVADGSRPVSEPVVIWPLMR